MDRIKRNARDLRKNMTNAERLLWSQLRFKQLNGLKFRRQHPIGNYVVDFVCIERKLIVELDGSQHFDNKFYDDKRTADLGRLGYRVLRFWDNEVFENLSGVMAVIFDSLTTPPQPSPW